MLYLEDYLEIIENLPIEMRDKFTEMREMDLQVANATDRLENRVESYFKKCACIPNLKQGWKEEQITEIRAGYSKALEDADEKVQLANQLYELIERHLRKLDQEVNKFKLELEADNAGITEIIEKRSLESEKNTLNHFTSCRPEKRKYYAMNNYQSHIESPYERITPNHHDLPPDTNFVYGLPKMERVSPTPIIFDHLGSAGGNTAIAMAASRAIGATLEMPKGRRTASLKASYEAVTKTVDLKDISPFARDPIRPQHLTPTILTHDTSTDVIKTSSRQKKPTQKSLLLNQQANFNRQINQQPQPIEPESPMLTANSPSEGLLNPEGGLGLTIGTEDPTEPRYCLCNDVSYGDMVGCDNEDCPFEWFHYGCVGLQQAPRGKWFCPQCLANMRRRSRK